MADAKVPFVTAYGNIAKALEKIRAAQVPPRFSQDFLASKLDMPGGSARPLIPFFKRTGFLAPDGTPTELYRRFRNESQSGAAAAEALRTGYAALYEVNEYIHAASDPSLKGVIVQVTGAEPKSSTVGAMVGSFKALKGFADFEAAPDPVELDVVPDDRVDAPAKPTRVSRAELKLGYTINLNLPATSDIAVFDAIFKSLREHLL